MFGGLGVSCENAVESLHNGNQAQAPKTSSVVNLCSKPRTNGGNRVTSALKSETMGAALQKDNGANETGVIVAGKTLPVKSAEGSEDRGRRLKKQRRQAHGSAAT